MNAHELPFFCRTHKSPAKVQTFQVSCVQEMGHFSLDKSWKRKKKKSMKEQKYP